jgi:RNA polymerase sigma-70 factor (ECF subfamily)
MKDPDLEIVERIINGDSNAFREIADKYKDKAFSLTVKILKNREEAEDSVQDAFIKLYRSILQNQFREEAKLSTYFYTIVYNTALDNYKKIKNKSFSVISIDVEGSNFKEGDELMSRFNETEIEKKVYEERYDSGTEKKISSGEIENIINRFINSIPEQYSLILNMFFINDLSHDEISKILSLPLGTVKNRIFRAKEKIKDIILKHYSEDEILEYI